MVLGANSLPLPFPQSVSSPTTPLPIPFVRLHRPRSLLRLRRRPEIKRTQPAASAAYEVGGGYPDAELDALGIPISGTHQGASQKLDPAQCEALLKGGEQVTSVLEEMITLVSPLSLSLSRTQFPIFLFVSVYFWFVMFGV